MQAVRSLLRRSLLAPQARSAMKLPGFRRFHFTPVALTTSDPRTVASGVPDSFKHRRVRIFQPARSPMQQGHGGPKWKVEFAHDPSWSNPLMGWTSSEDTTTQLHKMRFESLAEAEAYVRAQGFPYEIDQSGAGGNLVDAGSSSASPSRAAPAKKPRAARRPKKVKAYADNFDTKWYQ